ncbi:XkdQ/YqbQ family protein [Bacillus sp. FJAT-45350]|uniref:XkdQ/YqbQ family protein n=1 Tax=Bacillus sp. FJAT-45350 TaxID=2011014 RepID=UPI000BB91FAC|nr:hypothetical protein [Bacillus sp. FJAT-45350]
MWTASNNGLVNITPIVGAISWRSSIEELGQELDFDIAYNDSRFIPKNPVDVGQMAILRNGDTEVLRTIVISENKQGRQPIKYISFDAAFYLNKSKKIYQFNRMPGGQAIRKILTDFNIPIGEITSIPTIIDEIYPNESPSDIIRDILKQAEKDQGIKYRIEMRVGKLYILPQTDLLVKGSFRLARNLWEHDIQKSTAEPTRSRSIEEMKNKIQIVQDNQVIATLTDSNMIEQYGLLSDIVEVQDKDTSQARNIAKNMLKDLSRVMESNTIEMLGDDRVRAGRIIEIEEPVTGMKGRYLIESVEHTLKNGIHRMSLDLGVV